MNALPSSRRRLTFAKSFSSFSAKTAWLTRCDAAAERLVLDVAHHPALERPPDLRRALDRRDAADDRLRLDVLQHRLAVRRAQRVDRLRDRRQVVGILRPLVARGPRLLAGPARSTARGSCRRCGCAGRSAPGRRRPPVSTRLAFSKPGGGGSPAAATATMRPSRSMYSAPSGTSGRASSNVTRCPVTTSGAGSSGAGMGGGPDTAADPRPAAAVAVPAASACERW